MPLKLLDAIHLCVVQGVQACNLAVPVLAEELERKRQQAHGD
jgi:hypothetical protein